MAIEGPTLMEFLGKEFDEIVERIEKLQRHELAKAPSPKASKKEQRNASKDNTESETPNEVLDVAKRLYEMGFSVIPIKPMSKAPAIQWKEFEERRPKWEEVVPYFKPDSNLAVILGKVSNNLAVLDFETQDGWDKLKERLSEELVSKLESSWIEKSKRGLHVFFKLPFEGEDVKLKDAEIRATSKKYVLVYPSIHPEGVPYERIRGPESLVELSEEEWEELFKTFKEVFGPKREEKVETTRKPVEYQGDNASFDPTKWLDSFTKFWKEGVRHTLALGIAGTLAKNGVPVSEALELIRAAVERAGDNELGDRVRAVLDTYAAVGYDRESLLKECEEVVDPSLCKFSDREVEVAKLNTIVSTNEESFRAFYRENFSEFLKLVRAFEGQFKRKYEVVISWKFEDSKKIPASVLTVVGEEVVLKSGGKLTVVMKAPEEIKWVKVYPLTDHKLLKVKVEGEVLIDAPDKVIDRLFARKLAQPFMASQGMALRQLLEQMAESEEWGFYAKGPWIVEGKLYFVPKPLYRPRWRKETDERPWEPPEVNEEKVKEALIKVKKLVESYRDSSKASAVLSYLAIASFKYELVERLGYFPHMIVWGPRETGKSTLMLLGRMLLGSEDSKEHFVPKSKYQAERLLSLTKVPAILVEMKDFFNALAGGNKSVKEAFDVLMASSTDQSPTVKGGGESYAGFYLPIRAVIGATNLIPRMLREEDVDKFTFVKIGYNEGVEVEKALKEGALPKSLSPEEKRGLATLGKLLLEEMANILTSELDGLTFTGRMELQRAYLLLGYEAWRRVYEGFGLEPFPEPSGPETVELEEELKSEVLDLFTNFLSESEVIGVRVEAGKLLKEELTALLNKGVILIQMDGVQVKRLLFKRSLLKKFKAWAKRERGEEYDESFVIESLGAKERATFKAADGKIDRLIAVESGSPAFEEVRQALRRVDFEEAHELLLGSS